MEPVLVYERGKGWVYSDPTIVTMRCGTVVCLEVRTPNPGERFQSVRIESDWVKDGVLTEGWIRNFKDYRFTENSVWSDDMLDPRRVTCVVVPV
jgi:hypothetical protein